MKNKSLSKRFFRKARKIGIIANELTKVFPVKEDNLIIKFIKILACLETVERNISGLTKLSKREEFFQELEVQDKLNAHFVDIFFSTPLHELFKLEYVDISDYEIIIIASKPEIGILYFLESKTNTEQSTHFWFSPGFRFDLTLDLLWNIFNKRIHVNMIYDRCVWRLRTICSQLPTLKTNLVGKNEKIIKNLSIKHLQYSANNIARTYLFVGNPGVGKSIAALKFADFIGSKTLRIDASGLTILTINELDLLLSGMKPDIVIIDDVDKVKDLNSSLPNLLTMFQDMHRSYPEIVFILTAANISDFDSAMIRPERIDIIVKFEIPNDNDRKQMIEDFLKENNIFNQDIDILIKATEGLTAAYIKEACLRLKYDSQEEVLGYLKEMFDLFGEKNIKEKIEKEKAEEKDKKEKEKYNQDNPKLLDICRNEN